MAATTTTVTCALLAVFLYSFPNLWRVLRTWRFLLNGRAMMLDHSQNKPQAAYSLAIPGNRLHVVSSKEHWNDLNNAQTSQLSPNAASREMFQPKYTFGFDWSAPREHVSLATVRSIRNMTLRLPSFQERFVAILDEEFQRALSTSPKEGAYNEEFTTRGLKFVDQTALILESVRLVPSFLAPLVAKLIKGRGLEQQFVFNTLRGLIAKREAYKRSASEESRDKPETFLQGVIDYCQDDRSTQQNTDSINTTWVISTLAIPVVASQLLQDLYTQPDHFPALREEAQCVPLHDPARSHEISEKLEKLPLLEAFAMESMRTKCFQANTVHRVAMKPFQFSDGYKVQPGEAVEFHQHGLFNNESIYPDHGKFDPSRFLNKNRSLVDTGIEWPFWGVPRYICPGRWHVANVQKLLAVYIMQNFEAKFESTKGLNFEWRDALVPNPKTVVLMRPLSR